MKPFISSMNDEPKKDLMQPAPVKKPPLLLMKDTPLHRAAFIIILFWGLSGGSPFILPLLIAGLLAFLMSPLHRFLSQRLKVPEWISIIMSVLSLISPIALIGY